ncbi:charged multivesicular body protein 6-A-like protein [Dinothrombium tinctorium]|uniref:Charged multivesicular body protein 6-A-like protein n=1 Tax=Dinothrombium tinctorium TaxID=1965070 RepID=A0A443RR29_9ACAR|nr:charged multivesicular body protein 6-A-like protein [Dinothrombium tinctorium]
MGAIFGRFKTSKKPENRVTEQDKAILQLKQQRDKLKQYQKRVKEQLEKEKRLARELIQNNKKDKALLLLKKKKYMDTLLERTDQQLDNLEKMVSDIEFAQIEITVVKGLQKGNEALKQLHSIMSIEQIEDIMDETREGIEKQREIDNLIGTAFTEEEESELLNELEKMTAENEQETEFPEVPTHEPAKEKEKPREKEKPKKQLLEAS